MDIQIDLRNGKIKSSCFVKGYSVENLLIWGQVDCLHTSNGFIWHPNTNQIKEFLQVLDPQDIPSNAINIEGQYLMIWKHALKIFIFCDRYCQYPTYYRLMDEQIELFDHILDQDYNLVITQEKALAFIFLRYIPGRQTLFEGISQIMPGDCLVIDLLSGRLNIEVVNVYPRMELNVENEDLAAETFHIFFREALEQRLRSYSNFDKILLPLSGGLDSRYILGTTLELFPPSRILAMTFGQAGSYDFEIGRLVAQKAGVRHIAYPLTHENYSDKALVNNCLDAEGQINITTETPVEIYKDFSQYGEIMLSGVVGGSIMDSKVYPNIYNNRLHIVLKDTLVRNEDPVSEYFPRSLIEPSFYFQYMELFPLEPSEIWYFINHLTKYSFYAVSKFRDHFKYIKPFIDYTFIDYVLNLPINMLIEKRLYINWMLNHFPTLANLPCNLYRGVSLSASSAKKYFARQKDRIINYIFGINRRVNKIDFYRYRTQILGPAQLRSQMSGILPSEFERTIFENPRYYLLLYNLKCLYILRNYFNVILY